MRKVWLYKDDNAELIGQSINELNWQRAFLNTNVNEKVDFFNSTILNTLSDFIPHEFVVPDDKDPRCCNKKIRALIQEKMLHLKITVIKVVTLILNVVWNVFKFSWIPQLKIEVAQKYFHNAVNKLINTQRDCKLYWSILKISLNYKKIPVVLPLIYEIRFITDFKEKAELFIFFFSKQSSLIPKS